MTYAPIALFTYNRADKTQRVVESLLKNAEAKYSDLFIFSDGPKTPEKKAGVEVHLLIVLNPIYTNHQVMHLLILLKSFLQYKENSHRKS